MQTRASKRHPAPVADAAPDRRRRSGSAEAVPASARDGPPPPILPDGPPPPVVDVPVLASADLTPLDGDVAAALAEAATHAARDDWVTAARGLAVLRRGCVHHRAEAEGVM